MSLGYIIRQSLTLTLAYLILLLAVELAISNYVAYQISSLLHTPYLPLETSSSTLTSVYTKLSSLTLCSLKLVELTLWVYLHHPTYCISLLSTLAIYYQYKKATLHPPPTLGTTHIHPASYSKYTQQYTHSEVMKLKQSEAFRRHRLSQLQNWRERPR